MVVVECFDLKFDSGLYGGLAVVAVAHSGANGGYGGQPPLAKKNQIKPTTKKQKKNIYIYIFETHEAKMKENETHRCALVKDAFLGTKGYVGRVLCLLVRSPIHL